MGCLLAIAHTASSLPRFSLQKAEGCATCHVNPAGQGMRNAYATEVFATRELSATRRDAIVTAITKSIRIGGDIRSQGYVYVDDPGDATETTAGFFNMQADLYLNWDLGGHMSVYVENDLFHGKTEAYGMYAPKGHEGYGKVGAFLPNYGLRVDDHTAFIRGGNPRSFNDGLFWEPNYADSGIEIGLELADIEWTVGAYNGNGNPVQVDRAKDRAALVRGETHFDFGGLKAMLGANVYSDKSDSVDERMLLAGGFLGIGGDSWTLMGEVDVADNYLPTEADDTLGAKSLAAFVEATVNVRKGLHAVARAELFDPDTDAAAGTYRRISAGMEAYPVPYLEIKPTLRYTDQADGQLDLLEYLLQAHWWF